jgi:L-rhamnose-H+ transport protein
MDKSNTVTLLFGFVLVLVSGVMAGCVLAPIKFVRKYRFENYWLIYGAVGTVVIPWVLALSTTPNLLRLYSQLPRNVIILPPIFAFSWGIASMLGGLCVSRIGLSLTYALIIGIGASAGSLVPLLYFSPQTLRTPAGHYILSGIVAMLFGLVLVTWAGRQNESRTASPKHSGNPGLYSGRRDPHNYVIWVLIAVLAGILSAGLNFSFAFGQGVTAAARAAGTSASSATYPVWALAMLGGMVPNLVYPAILCFHNHSWRVFLLSLRHDLALSLSLGVLFMGSTVLYGLGAVRLGLLGTSVGWGIMQIMQIIVGNISGFLTGEWKMAGSNLIRLVISGIAILIAASIVMAYGNYIQTS